MICSQNKIQSLLFLNYIHQNSLPEITDWVYTIWDLTLNLQNILLKITTLWVPWRIMCFKRVIF